MPKYSNAQIAEALKKSKGMVYVAARVLGCSHNTILNRLKTTPSLREIKEAEEGVILDVAESRLGQQIYRGELSAIKFLLATKGHKRGYVESHKLELAVASEFEAMTEALEDGLPPDTFRQVMAVLAGDSRNSERTRG